MDMRLIALPLIALALGCATAPSAFPPDVRCEHPNEHPFDFYTAPVDEGLGSLPPGEILRVQHIVRSSKTALKLAGAVRPAHGAQVYRVLYRSTGRHGEPVVVSARVAVPDVEAPPGGFPVVAHQHGTSSLGDRCAPSKLSLTFGFESLLNPLAARLVGEGHIVVMSDYLGLGTPGDHPYVVAEPSAQAVWDGVRATHRFCDAGRGVVTPPSTVTVLEGHSQGAHATIAAWEAWPDIAPELELRAAVAMAPPPDPLDLAEAMALGDAPTAPVVLGLYGMTRWYPELGGLEPWLEPDLAADLPGMIDNSCAAWLGVALEGEPEDLFQRELVEALQDGDHEALEPLAGVLEDEALSRGAGEAPLLVVMGDEDELFPPSLVEDLVAGLAKRGAPAELLAVDGAGHLMLPARAEEDLLDWLAEQP